MKDGKEKTDDLRSRTKSFALRIIRLFAALPKSTESQVMGKQVLRRGTSGGPHYREGHRARSNAEFISKLETALMEMDETIYWLELFVERGRKQERLADLLDEANQLVAVFATCVKNAKYKNSG